MCRPTFQHIGKMPFFFEVAAFLKRFNCPEIELMLSRKMRRQKACLANREDYSVSSYCLV